MTHYLIEFRFNGKAKIEFKRLAYLLNSKFNLGFNKSNRPIPHITLVGPFYTRYEKRLISDFNKICNNYNLLDFRISGFNCFKDTKVVYLNIIPSKELENLRWALAAELKNYCNLKSFDFDKEFSFHSSLATHLSTYKFNQILTFTKTLKEPNYKYKLARITLIKNQRILCEYDFVLRKILFREEVFNSSITQKTIKGLYKKPIVKTPTFLQRIKKFFN